MNFLTVQGRGGASGRPAVLVLEGGGEIEMDLVARAPGDGQPFQIGIRPEHVELADDGLAMSVTLSEQLGGNTVLHGTLQGGQTLVVQTVGQSRARRGDSIHVRLPAASCHAFDGAGKAIATA